ncbi:flagellar protein FlgN [Lachnobacterium bovis]|uniref:FlgN protein n=1 Tax=Lachnobacterium bovis TaxID=140626 RepID=A0A1H9SDM1_9FIRM|nr:flagellar protein FlgN [Lachnobacterium bovis]SER83146.1 FlgN protein [Lachnobacterium bovis]
MASLVEELLSILKKEERVYRKMLGYAEKKVQVLVDANIKELEKITSAEQQSSDVLVNYSNQQIQLLKDIANVLGKVEGEMTVTKLIDMLDTQPEMQEKLTIARNHLIETATKVNEVNEQNKILIEQAIELNNFDITLFKSLRQAPETANYDEHANNTRSLLGTSGFDAKQ